MNLDGLTLASLREGLQQKDFSARELTDAYLERIRTHDGTLHAFLHVTEEGAREAADRVDGAIASGEELTPLSGAPLGIKDVIVTAGIPTTAGSKILEGYLPPYQSTVVERLDDAGAVLLGKTNCDEFAMGASGEHSAYGPTKNPWDTERVPGGSSSGSAAAVAAGECVAALGTDTGGSVRQPASFCGVVGLKPTYGRVSRYGLIALASSLDQIGTFTRTVEDAAILLNAIAGRDQRDATSLGKTLPDLAAIAQSDVRGLTIGVPKEYFVAGLSEDVAAVVRNAIKVLEAAGATVREVSLPHTEYGLAVYYLLMPAEASSNLARFDGIRYGASAEAADLLTTYVRTRSDSFGEEPKRRIMLGTYALSAGYHDAYYRKAQQVRTLIRRDFDAVFKEVDLLVTPTAPTPAFRLGEKTDDPLTMYLSDVYTVSANIAGIPGLSVPAGDAGGLPIGAQLLGPQWSEGVLLTAGNALERALARPLTLPALRT